MRRGLQSPHVKTPPTRASVQPAGTRTRSTPHSQTHNMCGDYVTPWKPHMVIFTFMFVYGLNKPDILISKLPVFMLSYANHVLTPVLYWTHRHEGFFFHLNISLSVRKYFLKCWMHPLTLESLEVWQNNLNSRSTYLLFHLHLMIFISKFVLKSSVVLFKQRQLYQVLSRYSKSIELSK